MSFSEDPFKHVAVTHKDGVFGWECNGCGAQSQYARDFKNPPQVFSPEAPVNDIALAFWQHIRRSHKLSPEDTARWS